MAQGRHCPGHGPVAVKPSDEKHLGAARILDMHGGHAQSCRTRHFQCARFEHGVRGSIGSGGEFGEPQHVVVIANGRLGACAARRAQAVKTSSQVIAYIFIIFNAIGGFQKTFQCCFFGRPAFGR